eukprot:2980930-Pleurochrysis_carterae.AAC.2
MMNILRSEIFRAACQRRVHAASVLAFACVSPARRRAHMQRGLHRGQRQRSAAVAEPAAGSTARARTSAAPSRASAAQVRASESRTATQRMEARNACVQKVRARPC